MGLCLAGICGGGGPAEKGAGEAAAPRRPVVKPVLRLDEEEESGPPSFDRLVSQLEMQLAPPGAQPPCSAVVSRDFPRNVLKLMVLLPGADSPEGAWSGSDSARQLLSWAEANGYATALFAKRALESSPSETFDRVLRGSPAGSVVVVLAPGTLPLLKQCLLPLHPLLLTRFRVACLPSLGLLEGRAPPLRQLLAEAGPDVHEELAAHLRMILMQVPDMQGWEPKAWHQNLFELLRDREERFQRNEAKKYAGFQDLKENDMPGLRRLTVEKRIERLGRDRGKDELQRLLQKHEKAAAGEEDEEPGVD